MQTFQILNWRVKNIEKISFLFRIGDLRAQSSNCKVIGLFVYLYSIIYLCLISKKSDALNFQFNICPLLEGGGIFGLPLDLFLYMLLQQSRKRISLKVFEQENFCWNCKSMISYGFWHEHKIEKGKLIY